MSNINSLKEQLEFLRANIKKLEESNESFRNAMIELRKEVEKLNKQQYYIN